MTGEGWGCFNKRRGSELSKEEERERESHCEIREATAEKSDQRGHVHVTSCESSVISHLPSLRSDFLKMTTMTTPSEKQQSSGNGNGMDSPKFSPQSHGDGFQFLSGLILAGMASTLLTTVFGLVSVVNCS